MREFARLLERWNTKINLISRAASDEIWERHILDSAQLLPLAGPHSRSWADLGSGGGLPGLVCAIMAHAQGRDLQFTLVEADTRKAAFLREAARDLAPGTTILNARIEQASLPPQDVLSARALAPLTRLLELSQPFCHAGTRLLLPKGRQANSELTMARRDWHSRVVRVPSRTAGDAVIFQISELRPRQ